MTVVLEKFKAVTLAKVGNVSGNIIINLNWTQELKLEGVQGFVASLKSFAGMKKSDSIDLDLGCFVELLDGSKYCLQPLGNKWGALSRTPYVQHSGDDRSGAEAEGETLTINTVNWNRIKRVLIYAYIYEGAPVWDKTDAVVKVICPGQEELVIKMDEYSSKHTCCALAQITNNCDKGMIVSKEIEFFKSQKPMDDYYNFGFTWRKGSKD